jgi:hypothetical protein
MHYIYKQYFIYRNYSYRFRCTCIIFRESYPSILLKLHHQVYKPNKISRLKCLHVWLLQLMIKYSIQNAVSFVSCYNYSNRKSLAWWLYIESGLSCRCNPYFGVSFMRVWCKGFFSTKFSNYRTLWYTFHCYGDYKWLWKSILFYGEVCC